MGRTLLRGVNDDLSACGVHCVPGRRECQIGMVALLAQMEQHEMAQGRSTRPRQHGFHQFRALPIREMAMIAQVPGDQDPGAPEDFCMATS